MANQTYIEFLQLEETYCANCHETTLFTNCNLAVFDGVAHIYCGHCETPWQPVVPGHQEFLIRYMQETNQL